MTDKSKRVREAEALDRADLLATYARIVRTPEDWAAARDEVLNSVERTS